MLRSRFEVSGEWGACLKRVKSQNEAGGGGTTREIAPLTGPGVFWSRKAGSGFFRGPGGDEGFFPEDGSGQVLLGEEPQKIKLQRLPQPQGGPPPQMQLEQHCRNQGQIKLDGHAARGLRQKMAAAQNAFKPAKKQFHLPAMA